MSSIFVYCEGANPSHRPPYTIGANPYIGPTESIVASWAAGICAVLGLFGNILSVVVFTSNDKLKKHSTTPFLLSLAISDLIFSGFNLPLLSLRYYYRDWKFGYGTCELFPFFYYSNISVTTFSMGLISLNRFIGIFYPEKLFKIFTPVSCAGMISGVWIISMGLMLLPFFEIWGHLGYEPKTFKCTILPRDDSSPATAFLTLTFVAPCILMVVCYGLIYWKVKQIGNEVRKVMHSSEGRRLNTDFEAKARKRENQLTRTFGVICAGYIICFLPNFLIQIIDPMPPCYAYPKLHVAGEILFMTSSFLTPICYTISNKRYRKAYIDVFRSLYCRRESFEESSMQRRQSSTPATLLHGHRGNHQSTFI